MVAAFNANITGWADGYPRVHAGIARAMFTNVQSMKQHWSSRRFIFAISFPLAMYVCVVVVRVELDTSSVELDVAAEEPIR